jgi:hypothetical protein
VTGQYPASTILLAPELIQPQIEMKEAAVIDRIDPARALGFDLHQPRVEQRLQVLGNRRAGNRQAGRQFVHGFWPAPELLEEIAAVRIRNCCKGIRFDPK